jgi:hypothetical protein
VVASPLAACNPQPSGGFTVADTTSDADKTSDAGKTREAGKVSADKIGDDTTSDAIKDPGKPFVPAEPDSVSAAVDRFTTAGYVEELLADRDGLFASKNGRRIAPEDLVVDAVVRIEGVSDPADEAIVLALHERSGPLRATWASAFGGEVRQADAEALRRLGPLPHP